jgi:hypothetical protein
VVAGGGATVPPRTVEVRVIVEFVTVTRTVEVSVEDGASVVERAGSEDPTLGAVVGAEDVDDGVDGLVAFGCPLHAASNITPAAIAGTLDRRISDGSRPATGAVAAHPEKLYLMVDVDVAVRRGDGAGPLLHTRRLDLLGAPALPAHQVVVVDGLRALPIEHLTCGVAHGVEIAGGGHVLHGPIDRGEADGRPADPQRLVQVLGRDELTGPFEHLGDRRSLRGVTALDGDHDIPSGRPVSATLLRFVLSLPAAPMTIRWLALAHERNLFQAASRVVGGVRPGGSTPAGELRRGRGAR